MNKSQQANQTLTDHSAAKDGSDFNSSGAYIPAAMKPAPKKAEPEIAVLPEAPAKEVSKDPVIAATATLVEATPLEQKPVAMPLGEREVAKLPSIYPPDIEALVAASSNPNPEIDQVCNQLYEYLCKNEEKQLDKVVLLMSKANATTRSQVFYRFKVLFSVGLETIVHNLVKSKQTFLHFAFLLLPPHVADAYILSLFIDDKINCSDSPLIMIMMGRTSQDLATLTAECSKQTGKDAISMKDFGSVAFSSSVKHMLKMNLQQPRPEYDSAVHTVEKARSDAEFIHKKGPGRSKLRNPFVNDKTQKEIIDVLVSSPPEHLQNIDKAYIKKYGYTLQKCIQKIFDKGFGELLHTTLFYINTTIDPYEGIAYLFYVYKKELLMDVKKKNNLFLTMLLIRYQDHLKEIEAAYQLKFETQSTLREVLDKEADWDRDDQDPEKLASLLLLDILTTTMTATAESGNITDPKSTAVLNPIFICDEYPEDEGNFIVDIVVDIAKEELQEKLFG